LAYQRNRLRAKHGRAQVLWGNDIPTRGHRVESSTRTRTGYGKVRDFDHIWGRRNVVWPDVGACANSDALFSYVNCEARVPKETVKIDACTWSLKHCLLIRSAYL
jgi:hypothetical protein